MGGMFGGGGKTVTTPGPAQQTMSPEQADYVRQMTPFAVENASLQTDLARQGTDMLSGWAGNAPGQLSEALQVSDAERGMAGTTKDVYGRLTPGMEDTYNYLGSRLGTDPTSAGIIGRLGQVGNQPALSDIIQQLSGGVDAYKIDPTRMDAATKDINDLMMRMRSESGDVNIPGFAPTEQSTAVDPNVLLGPMANQFKEEILPGIRAQALAAGATGGSSEADLTTRATGRYGSDAASMMAQQKAALINAAANMKSAEAQAYGHEVQGALGKGRLGVDKDTLMGNLALGKGNLGLALERLGSENALGFGRLGAERLGAAGNLELGRGQLEERGLSSAGALQGEQGRQGLMAAGQRSAVTQQLIQMGMAPKQAEAALASMERQMALGRINAPQGVANTLLSGGAGIPITQPQFAPMQYPGNTVENSPSAGAQAGSAMSSVMQMAMMAAMIYGMSSHKVKRNIKFIDTPSYLRQLREIPLAEWNYIWDPEDHPKRVGPIRELSPEQIRGPGLTMNPLGYAGMLHAGLKELDAKVSYLEEALDHA